MVNVGDDTKVTNVLHIDMLMLFFVQRNVKIVIANFASLYE